jgi:hypothetical protein
MRDPSRARVHCGRGNHLATSSKTRSDVGASRYHPWCKRRPPTWASCGNGGSGAVTCREHGPGASIWGDMTWKPHRNVLQDPLRCGKPPVVSRSARSGSKARLTYQVPLRAVLLGKCTVVAWKGVFSMPAITPGARGGRQIGLEATKVAPTERAPPTRIPARADSLAEKSIPELPSKSRRGGKPGGMPTTTSQTQARRVGSRKPPSPVGEPTSRAKQPPCRVGSQPPSRVCSQLAD